MTLRILSAAVLSALALFVWGFVYWGLFNAAGKIMKPLPAELDVLAAMRLSQAESGMYLYPIMVETNEQAVEKFETEMKEGPILQLAFQKEGGPVMPASKFALGFGHNLIIGLLASLAVAIAGASLTTFIQRVGFVALISLLAAVWSNGGDLVWWFHSPSYCVGNLAYMAIGGLFMGLVIAAIVKTPSEVADSQS